MAVVHGVRVVIPEGEVSRTAVAVDEANNPARPAGGEDPEFPLAGRSTVIRGRRFHLGSIAVALIGLTITAALAVGTQALHESNEDRLLHQRVKEAIAVVNAALPAVQTRLAPAAVLADAIGPDTDSLRNVIEPLVAKNGPYVSVSVWPTSGGTRPRPIVVSGTPPELASESAADIQAFLAKAMASPPVTINDLLSESDRRLGYGYVTPGADTRYVVYTEAALPKDRRAAVERNSAFSDLNYTLFLGDRQDAAKLLASSTGGTLVRGRRASEAVAFGDTKLLVVLAPQKELGGNLLARLPWILAGVGIVIALAAAALIEHLLRRREQAESLARENATLYAEQRTVAQTLQQSLLPDSLPQIAGLTLAARYVAGVEGIDVGGDWFDVMTLDGDRLLFVIGDVSGRGLRAATTMAELRYAIRRVRNRRRRPRDHPHEDLRADRRRTRRPVRDGAVRIDRRSRPPHHPRERGAPRSARRHRHRRVVCRVGGRNSRRCRRRDRVHRGHRDRAREHDGARLHRRSRRAPGRRPRCRTRAAQDVRHPRPRILGRPAHEGARANDRERGF